MSNRKRMWRKLSGAALMGALLLCNGATNGQESDAGEMPPARPADGELKKLSPEEIAGATQTTYWNDVARLIAGMQPAEGSEIRELEQTAAARQQRTFFEQNWDKVERPRLEPMRIWAEQELAEPRRANRPVFYPFGGPDFLHVDTFFPDAPVYVHFGLEPPGDAPDLKNMAAEERDNTLRLVRESLYSVLRWSFFRTNDMKVDLLRSRMGAAPVLIAFAARTGHVVEDVQNVHIDARGNLNEGFGTQTKGGASGPSTAPFDGVRIKLVDSETGAPSDLYYFSLNIADGARNQPFFKWMETHGTLTSYAKAASYLMHRSSFSRVRQFVLDKSMFYMQDDSGMPLKYFDTKVWELRHYGAYTRPIDLFRARYQADLRRVYQQAQNVHPLPFGIGYVYSKGRSNLMTARKLP